MAGTVITFYSYKGGVGRSFTMANIAVLLARWGYRVLTIDWDLEAPGLHHYFAPILPEAPRGGVIDLADDFLSGAKRPAPHILKAAVEGNGALSLLAAGKMDRTYMGRMQSIDWERLYEQGFANFLEVCRDIWTAEHDFVLIDSRTGISDIASICTAHLPDRLVVVFTANDQNLDEVVDITRRADDARDRMPYDRPRHTVLPVLSRLDNRVEYERADMWQRKCAKAVAPLFENWLVKSVPENLMLRHLTVPYVSYWSFGEQLPVLEEPVPSPDQISYALETIAAVIAQGFDRTDVLEDNRDAYVAAARNHHRDFDLDLLVSSPRTLLRATEELIVELNSLGVRAERSVSGDPEILQRTGVPAEHLCLLVDGEASRWQITEAERFLRHAIGPEGGQRQLFCVLSKNTDRDRLPGFLRNLRRLELGSSPALVARQLHTLIQGTPENESNHDALMTAATALRGLPEQMPYAGRFALVQETVRGMAAALDSGDMELLLDHSADLVLISKTRGNGSLTAMPPELRAVVGALLARIDRRLTAFTD
ncbi:CobQ/CobB/MinD/ParA nucleotide binding domain-containing protein [Lentzea xinjiangensis]|uniref:CobQ/CobB/MinD/ParA nucleotide binding domain-containing protein n=1 Tax=Lentzea xinjiangensis TaxID=402600 RepID=A0A1H9T2Y7_9PSEU|nr:AAA family ATPase [Lentzea xinjiangensis]SER91605.1 CobQ/CobB/MinD/ParA nucleotide binding domain-containing protein [Lentzea xinjiangensis]